MVVTMCPATMDSQMHCNCSMLKELEEGANKKVANFKLSWLWSYFMFFLAARLWFTCIDLVDSFFNHCSVQGKFNLLCYFGFFRVSLVRWIIVLNTSTSWAKSFSHVFSKWSILWSKLRLMEKESTKSSITIKHQLVPSVVCLMLRTLIY